MSHWLDKSKSNVLIPALKQQRKKRPVLTDRDSRRSTQRRGSYLGGSVMSSPTGRPGACPRGTVRPFAGAGVIWANQEAALSPGVWMSTGACAYRVDHAPFPVRQASPEARRGKQTSSGSSQSLTRLLTRLLRSKSRLVVLHPIGGNTETKGRLQVLEEKRRGGAFLLKTHSADLSETPMMTERRAKTVCSISFFSF